MTTPVDAPPTSSFSLKRVLIAAIPLAIVCLIVVREFRGVERAAQEHATETVVARMMGETDAPQELAAGYADADGNLIADAPTSAEDFLDPETLTFSYVASADSTFDDATWAPFVSALAEQIGRPLQRVNYTDAGEQIRALRDGTLHVAAFSTGAAVNAVNEAGFVPFACVANGVGQYGITMKVIVPAGSEIRGLADLRGRRIAFTRPRSNSGYRAALAALLLEADLQPERDYRWGFTYGHENSIRAIAAHRSNDRNTPDAAAVASDLLDQLIRRGEVTDDAVVSIYESKPFPPAVFGYAHCLAPELQERVRAALLGLELTPAQWEATLGAPPDARLVEVSYASDWEPVRKVNKALHDTRAKLVAP
ncbi:MAG: phosphate/phosphite/phosphonate ABC transporter substrate-binding protein [Planctomycetales bacterium]|nr:phosphate/phosphite/phosphonate ABC transporter substrate-binding protein [Planctomycetales bacterium]